MTGFAEAQETGAPKAIGSMISAAVTPPPLTSAPLAVTLPR